MARRPDPFACQVERQTVSHRLRHRRETCSAQHATDYPQRGIRRLGKFTEDAVVNNGGRMHRGRPRRSRAAPGSPQAPQRAKGRQRLLTPTARPIMTRPYRWSLIDSQWDFEPSSSSTRKSSARKPPRARSVTTVDGSSADARSYESSHIGDVVAYGHDQRDSRLGSTGARRLHAGRDRCCGCRANRQHIRTGEGHEQPRSSKTCEYVRGRSRNVTDATQFDLHERAIRRVEGIAHGGRGSSERQLVADGRHLVGREQSGHGAIGGAKQDVEGRPVALQDGRQLTHAVFEL